MNNYEEFSSSFPILKEKTLVQQTGENCDDDGEDALVVVVVVVVVVLAFFFFSLSSSRDSKVVVASREEERCFVSDVHHCGDDGVTFRERKRRKKKLDLPADERRSDRSSSRDADYARRRREYETGEQ